MSTSRAAIPKESLRVLIVEPEEASRSVLLDTLGKGGGHVDGVSSATVAQQEFAPESYHVVFIALSEERESAFELARYCASLPSPPVVLGLVDSRNGAAVSYAYEAGIHGVLQKPLEHGRILTLLDRALGDRSSSTPVRTIFDFARRLRVVGSVRGLRQALRTGALVELLDAQLVTLVLPAWESPVLLAQKGITGAPGILSPLARHLRSLWQSYAGPETSWNWRDGLDDFCTTASDVEEEAEEPVTPIFVSAPIHIEGEISGFLTFSPRQDVVVDENRLDALHLIAEILSSRLENAVYVSEAESVESQFDSLTGVLNHGTIMTRLGELVQRAKRLGTTLSVIVVDLDDLAAINERCGHGAGDAALKQTGRLILAQARKTDLVGRLSGEEFVALLPGTEREGARHYAERIRRSLTANLIRHGNHEISVTASIGVVTAEPEEMPAAEQLVALAHDAARQAYGAGGNQVASASVASRESRPQ